MDNPSLIVLTCTVQPKSPSVARSSVSQRLEDYKDSIQRWSSFAVKHDKRILVLENSQNLERLKKYCDVAENANVEWQECPLDEESKYGGISLGEFLMLREAMNNSVLSKKTDFIWKVTGRNFVSNAHSVICKAQEADGIVFHHNNPNLSFNSRMFGFKPKLWELFVSQIPKFEESSKDLNKMKMDLAWENHFNSMEHYLSIFVAEIVAHGFTVIPVSRIPMFSGYSGSTNKKIDSNLRKFLIGITNPARGLIRKLSLGATP